MRFPSAVSAPRLRKVRGDGTFPKAKPPHANRLTCQGAGAGRGSGHLGRGALRRDGDDVAGGLVVEEVREGVSGQDGLGDKAAKGEHGQPAVCELLHLEVRLLGRVGREAERVEAVVARRVVPRLVRTLPALKLLLHGGALEQRRDANGCEPKGAAELAEASVQDGWRAAVREVEHRLGAEEIRRRLVQQLRPHPAGHAEHRQPPVLNLRLAVRKQVRLRLGEVQRVKADVARQLERVEDRKVGSRRVAPRARLLGPQGRAEPLERGVDVRSMRVDEPLLRGDHLVKGGRLGGHNGRAGTQRHRGRVERQW
mmetsp:Transcript_1798/g.4986  ORF Transcript_1798/g.4986 Transcript_1798/m.4986 type:complete len:311 (-) Transcript_1798:77-1009(-)